MLSQVWLVVREREVARELCSYTEDNNVILMLSLASCMKSEVEYFDVFEIAVLGEKCHCVLLLFRRPGTKGPVSDCLPQRAVVFMEYLQ